MNERENRREIIKIPVSRAIFSAHRGGNEAAASCEKEKSREERRKIMEEGVFIVWRRLM
ncbi:hypothetical protein K0M31_004475 [Melipona bicolor]|uniref:Uncharacterized protein n=1 Tax=Melipona bicolor TaxID=60889 RepID=A0AA40FWU9_9HYME|nr:hypothetical protein K0M31_004475 [Melipona bicolor]